jgi:acetyl-CoA carboxylase carboxyltransferase component
MSWQNLIESFQSEANEIRLGGGKSAIARQHEKGRLTARERIQKLLDADSYWLEIGLWAAWQMYTEWGGATSASVICGLGKVSGRTVTIIANDATTKAGALFPMTCKFRQDFSQQRGDFSTGYSAARGNHGQLRRGWRIFAGALR